MAISPAQLAAAFDAHAASLVLYARQWLDRQAAEDAVQDVFLRLLSQRGLPANLRAWLFRSVRNEAISHTRSQYRRRQREQAVAADRPGFFRPDPADLIDARSAQAALESLPHSQREVIVLRLWGGLTLAEVASLVGEPVSTVFDQYRAALANIREKLESSCNTRTI